MDPFATSHFSHDGLLHDARTRAAQDHRSTAILLSRLAEIDERKLYAREGYASMHDFCIRDLRYDDGAAYKRIHAARAARRFPAVLVALAEGRLHLRGILMLAPHLTSANTDELVAAATHKTRDQIELMLARRFPRPDLVERLQPIPPSLAPTPITGRAAAELVTQLTPEQARATVADQSAHGDVDPPPEPASEGASEQVEARGPRPRVTALAAERFGLQLTIDQETHELLRRAQALMNHQVPTGEIAPVLKSALKLLVGHLEKRKYAATTSPGKPRPSASPRHIPAGVKRAVRARDGDRCSFISDTGRRCEARTRLELDHKEPVGRGGESTADNVRLVCRAHNQHAAERAFGTEFMERKRAEARDRARRKA